MPANAHFWDNIADRYARQPISDEAAYQEKLARTRALFTPDSTVLEFACGTGGTALAHAPYVRQITAIDLSAGMLKHAREKLAHTREDNVRFECKAIEDLPLPETPYDVILGMSILHLLDDRAQVFERIDRMLKPGGYFVSSSVCLGDWMSWFRFIAPIVQWTGKIPQISILKADQLVSELERAGFEIVDRWQPKKKSAVFIIARKPA